MPPALEGLADRENAHGAEYYEKAAECRRRANQAGHPESRHSYERLARSYDGLANVLELVEQSRRSRLMGRSA
jgi:hypothetical protein